MNFDNLIISNEGALRTITINRPEKLNALNRAVIKELSDALSQAENDKGVRAVILTGAGEKAFVAGADISEFAHFSNEEGQKLSAEGHKLLFNAVEKMGTPVIAAVNGFALGGGLELAMSCHIRVASDNARVGLPEVSLGVIPGYGGTQRLAQFIGKGRALEMITTAQMITAAEAHNMGLMNHVVPQVELMEKCVEIAKKIIRNSPVAIKAAIRAVNAQYTENVDGYSVEIDAFGSCFGSDDFKEGTTAFLEKRKPNFSGN
ncbi:enoyl-CoA hydratase [Cryomorpha ignava]|uniref:Enoyl-CoA hydratase n=1 Tax=Cryomorpha ignava TaxID=101383 RepID=A0A7K3WKD8_9FLAO|nr:enoyl-CoA hydratase-related protein [Cryomorpha ignava]NEN22106.1 enoyl-CoA hydratase [Cryomorpha ignava]